ncbi:CBS domain-containing protein [Paraflavitalea soli]|uniref:CBS domain-containing protein n=1 Tax=Paraflavitalea soli TaxID=2315862 RepID=A0A3B7MGL4_9BACT|nr:chloride channel protein [Paraflavitalea soli]AXY73512.1 CBS domain-containing protein [Paraflavitalea soli]
MAKHNKLQGGIPISTSLASTLASEHIFPHIKPDKKRTITIALLAIGIGACVSCIARLLIYLIDLVTNLAFYGHFSIAPASPATHHLGLLVIIVPVVGGFIVGLMALYGSKAIRGHGIPEAMEQILVNQSKIKPAITYLKPVSSAIAIGTGGPFGAEGPIIATGGALGSTIGQILKITHNERKILLAAGATAGMSAIFGSPVAAIFLAIELLLFEFSPRSIIPVSLACITGAAGHHFLFEPGPVFFIAHVISMPSNEALFAYSIMGICLGVLSVLITKAVYFIEDMFEKLPIHWMWWPAIGGLAVGIIGYFAPRTLGVGYENITDVLSGSLPIRFVLTLCLLKFLSWAIALGSGTSGGTLAPLLTIGGATGALLGTAAQLLFPQAGISLSLAALVGMSAIFAGASRALLTSIIFAVETTAQSNALLPLLAACCASYFVSFFLMENTIMTEKIARRGVKTPHSYEPDMLDRILVSQVTQTRDRHPLIGTLLQPDQISIPGNHSLGQAAALMAQENVDVLPVVGTSNSRQITGLLSYKDILAVYNRQMDDHVKKHPVVSLKRRSLKVFIHGKKLMEIKKSKQS